MPQETDTLENLGRLPTFGMAQTGGAVSQTGAEGTRDAPGGAVPRGVIEATDEETSGLNQGLGLLGRGLGAEDPGVGAPPSSDILEDAPPGPPVFDPPRVQPPPPPGLPPGGLAGLLPPVTPPSSDILTDAVPGGPVFDPSRATAPPPDMPPDTVPGGGLADLVTEPPGADVILPDTVPGGGLADLVTEPPGEPVGGLRDIGGSDTPIGDTLPGGTSGDLVGGALGLGRIIQAGLATDAPLAQRVAEALRGLGPAYNAAARLAEMPGLPPWLMASLAAAASIPAMIEADNPAQAAGIATSTGISTAAALAGGSTLMMIPGMANMVHAAATGIMSMLEGWGLGHEPSHGERERADVAAMTPHIKNLVTEVSLATTPEELWHAMTRTRGVTVASNAPSVNDLLADPGAYRASVQRGVLSQFLDPMNAAIEQAVQRTAWMLRAADAGLPAAQADLDQRRGAAGDLMARAGAIFSVPTGGSIDPESGAYLPGTGPSTRAGIGSIDEVTDQLLGMTLDEYATSPGAFSDIPGVGASSSGFGAALADLPTSLLNAYPLTDFVAALLAPADPNVESGGSPSGLATLRDMTLEELEQRLAEIARLRAGGMPANAGDWIFADPAALEAYQHGNG